MSSFSVEPVTYLINDDSVAARVYVPAVANQHAVIFVHGWKSNKDSPSVYAEFLATHGYCCLTFDLRGMGESDGDLATLTRKDFVDDVLAAYDFLDRTIGPDRVCIVGSSFGAYLACLLTELRSIEGVGLRVPADYDDAGFDSQPQVIMSDRLDREGLMAPKPIGDSRATEALQHYFGEVLIVESEHDTIIDPVVIQRFVRAAPAERSTYRLMKGAPHSLSGHPDLKQAFGTLLLNWLDAKAD